MNAKEITKLQEELDAYKYGFPSDVEPEEEYAMFLDYYIVKINGLSSDSQFLSQARYDFENKKWCSEPYEVVRWYPRPI